MTPAAAACPCGRLDARRRPLNWAACCGRYIDHFSDTPAPDAESLMRSRYSAFVCERAEYLLEHGMLDRVTHRKELREELVSILRMLTRQSPPVAGELPPPGQPVSSVTPESVPA